MGTFYLKQTLAGVDTYNVRQIRESLTGRTKITHMYENDLGSLQPSVAYLRTKQFIDSVLVLLSFPIVLPVMLITAILIKLESEGPVLFIQNVSVRKVKNSVFINSAVCVKTLRKTVQNWQPLVICESLESVNLFVKHVLMNYRNFQCT
ncbi:undecaprenyl-galactosyl transferase [Actinobacillus equuli]|nr:undecaprenyl-galactosyl transferase [Actinobacillus equuli]